MRVLVIASNYKPAFIYGGPVHSVSSMCEALSRLGIKVTVFTTNANGGRRLDVPLAEPVNQDGVEVFYYPVDSILPPSFFYSSALAQACRRNIGHFDIVVLETFFAHAMGSAVAACTKMGVPYIVSIRGQLLPWSLRQKSVKKKLYLALVGRSYLNRAAGVHCTVPAEADALKKLGLDRACFVVPNGVNSHRFAHLPPRGILRQRLNIPDHARLLLFLGRVHSKKRPDIAVEALAAAQGLLGETHLVLAGP
ncbi:MAG: glycosyltransferase, partial [Anaerolineales bacterium]|nr:glycosyltransferase [Anaerolineales bacterium]